MKIGGQTRLVSKNYCRNNSMSDTVLPGDWLAEDVFVLTCSTFDFNTFPLPRYASRYIEYLKKVYKYVEIVMFSKTPD